MHILFFNQVFFNTTKNDSNNDKKGTIMIHPHTYSNMAYHRFDIDTGQSPKHVVFDQCQLTLNKIENQNAASN